MGQSNGWPDMRHAQTRRLCDHWQDLTRRGAPPDRNDLDPAAIAPALQDIFILGRGPDGLWRYRVAGTRLSCYADRDLRAELFTGWWRPQDRFDMTRLLQGVAADRLPVIGGVSGLSTRQERHDLEFVLLPLRHGGRDAQRMIGGFFPFPATAARFDVRIDELSVISLRNLAEPSVAGTAFGQPHADLDARIERRHGLRVIPGGLS
jgi:hypothetical protein